MTLIFSKNREQSFGNSITFTDFIASTKISFFSKNVAISKKSQFINTNTNKGSPPTLTLILTPNRKMCGFSLRLKKPKNEITYDVMYCDVIHCSENECDKITVMKLLRDKITTMKLSDTVNFFSKYYDNL